MRWSYLGPRLVLAALAWAFLAFAFDPLVRWSIIRTGQAVADARVEIADVDTRLFPPGLELAEVRVANRGQPGTNLFEFDRLRLRLAGTPLLHRSLVVKEGTLTGLRWGTTREDSGRLERRSRHRLTGRSLAPLRRKAGDLVRSWLNEALQRGKKQLDPRQLETVRLSEQLEQDWKHRFDSLEVRLRSLEGRSKTIRGKLRDSDGNVLDRLAAWQQAGLDVNQLLRDAAQLRSDLSQLSATARDDSRRLDEARRRDLDTARRKIAAVATLDGDAVSEALFGRELLSGLEQVVAWVEWSGDKLGDATADLKPQRGRGIDVVFPRTAAYPDLLIRKLSVTGETRLGGEPLAFSGVLTGLTSDPALHGRPATLRLTATGRGQLELEAVADHTRSRPEYEISAVYTIPDRTEADLGGDEQVVVRLAAERTQWRTRLRLTDEQISGTMAFRQEGVTTTVDAGDDHKLASVLSSILAGIDTVDASIEIRGSRDQPEWSLQSNLGPQIASRLNSLLATELARSRNGLLARVDVESRQRLAAFAALVNTGFQDSSARLDLSESAGRRLIDQVSSRALDVGDVIRR